VASFSHFQPQRFWIRFTKLMRTFPLMLTSKVSLSHKACINPHRVSSPSKNLQEPCNIWPCGVFTRLVAQPTFFQRRDIRLGNYFAPARRHWKDGKLYFTPESAFRRLSLRGRSPSLSHRRIHGICDRVPSHETQRGLDGKWKAIANLVRRAEFWLNHRPPSEETF
jgi:hypothetical protein